MLPRTCPSLPAISIDVQSSVVRFKPAPTASHSGQHVHLIDAPLLSCQIRARTKSLFSIMKKLLWLDDLSQGGRDKEDIYDILGMRVIVQPREDLPPAEVRIRVLQHQEGLVTLRTSSSHYLAPRF